MYCQSGELTNACCWYVHPQSRLKVNLRWWIVIALSSRSIGYIVNRLGIGHAIQEYIGLLLQSAIGHATKTSRERKCFRGESEFEDILVRWIWDSWWRERVCELCLAAVWAKYHVQTSAFELAREARQHT